MQELVVESLVVSLAMVVFSVLVDETTQMPLAERDHACERWTPSFRQLSGQIKVKSGVIGQAASGCDGAG